MRNPRIFAALIAALVVASAADARAQAQDAAQQKCLNAMTGALTAVAKAQQKEVALCLKAAATGDLPVGQTAEQCLTADAKGKVAKATAKTVATVAKSCGTAPSFGFAGAVAVNGAGVDESLDLEQAIFGTDLDAAVILQATDKAGAGCQAQIATVTQQLLQIELAMYRACKKAGLKDGSVTSTAGLDACLDPILFDPKDKIAKTLAKISKILATKCEGVTLSAAFPGACGGDPSPVLCLGRRATCETCQMVVAADDLDRDCDIFDDGSPNSSCGLTCIDNDEDGYGPGCAAGPDCDDTLASVHPGADEICNGDDDDCDGTPDDSPVDAGLACDAPPAPPMGATSACSAGTTACNAGVLFCDGAVYPSQPLDGCNVDSNCDGFLSSQPDFDGDVANCGGCGTNCYAGSVHASFTCETGSCTFTGCQSGWYDTDGNNTCEYPCTFISAQEACNGLDDNCNGQIDENLVPPPTSEICGTSPLASGAECTTAVTRTCVNGAWQCAFPAGVCSPSCGAATDTCAGGPGDTGLDNDCNGFVDDDPGCQSCASIPESCNSCDDDCDGFADDGAPAQVPCGLASPPNCVGVRTCAPPQPAPFPGACVPSGGYGACSWSPIAESCDGVDNDCDTIVDDGVPSSSCEPSGTPPGRNYGPTSQCRLGQTTCSNATTLCQGYVGPSAEVCDGIDNDCDGAVDEAASGVGQTCGISTGPCSPGLTACVNGAIVCTGGVGPQPEICDGIDNDCDGTSDDFAFCPSGSCLAGTCQ